MVDGSDIMINLRQKSSRKGKQLFVDKTIV